MLDGDLLPGVGPAEPLSFIRWFADLEKIFHHPYLKDDEKLLWLWLATQCAKDLSIFCSMSIEQISLALNKSPDFIHCSLIRLVITGFLSADIPVYYDESTLEMVKKVYSLLLKVPHKIPEVPKEERKEEDNAVVLPRKHCENITLNLINNQEKDIQPKPLSLIEKMRRIINEIRIDYVKILTNRNHLDRISDSKLTQEVK